MILLILLTITILGYIIYKSRKPLKIQSRVSPRQTEILTLKSNIYSAPYSKSFVKKTKLRYN